MKYLPRILALVLAGFIPVATAQTAAPAPATAPTPTAAPPAAKVDAAAAIIKKDARGSSAAFEKRHEGFLARLKEGPVGLLFLGDSITDGWRNAARAHIWNKYYGSYQPANFGIGGDQTQHVIWRIENGELEGIHPTVTVLMLGTNNTGTHTAEEIAAADKKIVEMIRAKIPETKVLLLAIFPRGARRNAQGVVTEAAIADADKRMAIIGGANAILAKLDDGKNVRFLDIGPVFLGQDGKIPFSIMPDQLHPNTAGYQLWAEAMLPLLDEMMR